MTPTHEAQAKRAYTCSSNIQLSLAKSGKAHAVLHTMQACIVLQLMLEQESRHTPLDTLKADIGAVPSPNTELQKFQVHALDEDMVVYMLVQACGSSYGSPAVIPLFLCSLCWTDLGSKLVSLQLQPPGRQHLSEGCHSPLRFDLWPLVQRSSFWGGRLHEQGSHSAESMLSRFVGQCA